MARCTTIRYKYLILCISGIAIYSLIKWGIDMIYFTSIGYLAVYDQENTENQTVSSNLNFQMCNFPDLNISDDTLAQYFHNRHPIICDSEPDWICVDGGVASVCADVKRKHKRVECNFTFLRRVSDHDVADGEQVRGSDSKPVKLKSDFFRVKCRDAKGLTWSNVMAGIYRDRKVMDRTGKEHLPKDSLELNILIWGHDSLSRLTFMRKFPKTYKYLTETLSAIVLKGYNVVGDGTSQALIPILTGKTERELPETRKKMNRKAQFVNIYPFIWNDFRNHGYVTAYVEDTGVFTNRLMGFKEQPTDHYMRTFYLAVSKEYGEKWSECIRATPRHKVTMNWIKQLFLTYPDKPKFVLNFLTALNHNDSNLIGEADEDLYQMINFFQSKNFLKDTLLIVMSDHGSRHAKFRETLRDKQEERLPFFAFVFPPWFKIQHPISTMNFVQNSERLTTPFDIYPTLRNILHFEGPAIGSVNDRGISLFNEIPIIRTCKDAAIDAHWCSCLYLEPVDVASSTVVAVAQEVVQYINELTRGVRNICETIELDRIIWAGELLPTHGLLKFKHSEDEDGLLPNMSDGMKIGVQMYRIEIQVKPGDVHFEATLKNDKRRDKVNITTSDVSRLSKYGNTAECLEDVTQDLRKYCYCKGNYLLS